MPGYARKNILKGSLCHHVFNRGISRRYIFEQSADKEYFCQLLMRYKKKGKMSIYHWVIMNNHYHMLVELEHPESISCVMSGIGRAYTSYYHAKYESSGYLWEGRFKSQAVQKEEYLLSCGRYIERNPLKAGMSRRAEDYTFSSAAYYVKGNPDGITDKNRLYEVTGKTREERQLSYRKWLEKCDAEEEKYFDIMENPVIGKEEFKAALRKQGGHFIPRESGRLRA